MGSEMCIRDRSIVSVLNEEREMLDKQKRKVLHMLRTGQPISIIALTVGYSVKEVEKVRREIDR